MGLLFLIILALLQFRVIQDTYLLLLCYGILVIASVLCVMSMPSLSKYVPIDTKEVKKSYRTVNGIAVAALHSPCMYLSNKHKTVFHFISPIDFYRLA